MFPLWKFIKIKEYKMSIFYNCFQKIDEETCPTTLYEVTISVLQKCVKAFTEKRITEYPSWTWIFKS